MIDFLSDIGIQKLIDQLLFVCLFGWFFSLNMNHLGQTGIYLQALMGLEQSYRFLIQNAKRHLGSASVSNVSLKAVFSVLLAVGEGASAL